MELSSLFLAGKGSALTSFFSTAFLVVFLPFCLVVYSLMPRRGKKYFLLAADCAFFWLISGKLLVYLLLTALSIVATVLISIPLGVLAAVQRFCAKREAMVEIAADGQIAESEQAEWDEIMCLANDLNVAMNNMRFSKGGRQS